MSEERTDAEPRKKRRWWMWIVVPLALLIGSGLVYVVVVSSGLRRLVAETDRLDPGWRLEEIEAKRATYPPERDAAVKILKINAMVKQTYRQLFKDEELLRNLDPPALLNEQQQNSLNKLLEASGDAIVEARTMIDFPRGRHVIPWSPDWISTILKCQANRDAVRLLHHDALDLAQRGDADQALRSVHACFHCGCSIGDEPMMISQLVRIACQAMAINALERVLAQGEPSEATMAAFQKRLEVEELSPLLLIAFRGERAGQYELMEFMRAGNIPAGLAGGVRMGRGSAGQLDVMTLLLRIPGVLASQSAACMRFMNDMVEIAKQPPEQWTAKFAVVQKQAADLPMLARLLAPAVDSLGKAVQRSHAHQRCAIVVLAAERFRKKNNRWPESIDELVTAGLLKEAPKDPFDGKPLRYKRTADGLVVYSVSYDLQDDGGNLDRQNPTKTGVDYGLQLWDVAKRRQPAPPPKKADDEP